jgi:hypothetical protein
MDCLVASENDYHSAAHVRSLAAQRLCQKTIKLLCLSNKRREASTTGAIVRRLDSSDAGIAILHILKQTGSKVHAALTWTHLCSDLTIKS